MPMIAEPAPFSESILWNSIPSDWTQLAGDIQKHGFSIEWHQFHNAGPLPWDRSFHPDSLEICLNLTGAGKVFHGSHATLYHSGTAGFYCLGQSAVYALREAGTTHQFVTIELSRRFLQAHLLEVKAAHPVVREFLQHGISGAAAPVVLTQHHKNWITAIRKPPVVPHAQHLWYLGKTAEIMVDFLFDSPAQEFFCQRQQRIARERVERATAILQEDLAAPPSLEELGRRVGCSGYYLSRTFSREMGMTIPQFLRKARMERAATLLLTGKFNVTEAAMEVGYSSLSHFSHAFCQTIGCCPNLYPHMNRGMPSVPPRD